ncbi:putative beta-taxilin [Scophthalmus maximus]|uniref:Putative beta-taxilin n=1 Tax=Scophthalmus maximus TaxID=52904 RepID=A0A2U9CXT9_SCOMX|nr:putative beta-taxilin [Scophthalmus maximus]
METSVKAAKVLATPPPDVASSSSSPDEEPVAAAGGSSSNVLDPMLEFSRRLEDIVSAHGAAAGVLDTQSAAEADKTEEGAAADITVTMETDVSLTMQSLNNLSSPQEKLESLARKFAEMAAWRRCDGKKLCVLQQKLSSLQEEKQQLQAERRSSVAARGELEALCRDMQSHYNTLREDTLQRCREDEEKRSEITSHFQKMLTDIQAQIEQHSTRNDKLCHENANLSDKLEGLMSQCELREESLEKLSRHRELQHKLTEAKLEESNALLAQAQEKHHREKEYEDTLQRCREDEEKRSEITSHFQKMLTDIQAQIEQHSTRNDKLCHENANLSDKLEGLMSQCELREESLEKLSRHRELQHKLTEAKLEESNALLAQAQEKHHREKEYLLREAIDKTKKCFAMKEQELSMKKKLTLYAQKFDEFQATLAKSNEIYVRFKKEMDNMSDKMKKMEKESNLWKTRFENCNKALTDMIEERKEKGKDYDLFVLKIQKLEKLCRVLQEERKILYEKIKEVRKSNSALPAKVFGSSNLRDTAGSEGADEPSVLTPGEIQELQEDDPVLTEDMARLREQQTKLQEFAASLLDAPADTDKDDSGDVDLEEDMMASVFVHFKTKTQVKEEPVSVPEPAVDVSSEATDADLPPKDKVETVVKSDVSTPGQVEVQETQQVKPDEEIQQQPPAEEEPTPEAERVETDPPTEAKPEAAETEMFEKPCEVKPLVPEDDKKLQQQPAVPVQVPEEAATTSESAAPSENTPAPSENTPAPSNGNSSKTQAPKKKKKRAGKNSS